MRQADLSQKPLQPVGGCDPWVRRLVAVFAVGGTFLMGAVCLDWPSAHLPSFCGNCRRSALAELGGDGGLVLALLFLNWLIAVREVPRVARWARCAVAASTAMWAVAWVFALTW
jgi:hypothetical protein